MFEQILTPLQVHSVLFFDHKIYTSGILVNVLKKDLSHFFIFLYYI